MLLEALRRRKLDAYRCEPQDGAWTADCPACGERRALSIRESRAGKVSMYCRYRCDTDAITAALARAPGHDDPWELAATWEQIALDMGAVATCAIQLLDLRPRGAQSGHLTMVAA